MKFINLFLIIGGLFPLAAAPRKIPQSRFLQQRYRRRYIHCLPVRTARTRSGAIGRDGEIGQIGQIGRCG